MQYCLLFRSLKILRGTRPADSRASHAAGPGRIRSGQPHPAQGITAAHQRLPVGRQPAAARDHSRRSTSHLRLRARQLHPDAAHRREEDEPDDFARRHHRRLYLPPRNQAHYIQSDGYCIAAPALLPTLVFFCWFDRWRVVPAQAGGRVRHDQSLRVACRSR